MDFLAKIEKLERDIVELNVRLHNRTQAFLKKVAEDKRKIDALIDIIKQLNKYE